MLTTVAQGDQSELFPDTPEFDESEAVDYGDNEDPEDEVAIEEDLSEDCEEDEDDFEDEVEDDED